MEELIAFGIRSLVGAILLSTGCLVISLFTCTYTICRRK